ncbi:hypothetical protein [[Eubacterium] cellulosolvens]
MRSLQKQYLSFFLVLLLVGIQGCVSSNPIARAETVEQKAYATYGTFVIFEEQAAKLVSSGTLPASAVQTIADADRRAKPVADSLLDAVREFNAIRAEFEAGGTGEERYIAAINNLNGWIEQAAPLINNLVAAVKGAE